MKYLHYILCFSFFTLVFVNVQSQNPSLSETEIEFCLNGDITNISIINQPNCLAAIFWQISLDGTKFVKFNGGEFDGLNEITPLNFFPKAWYRARIVWYGPSGNGCNLQDRREVTTARVLVKEYDDIISGDIGYDQQVCKNSDAEVLSIITNISGGSTPYMIQWQSTPLNVGNWVNIFGENQSSYLAENITEETQYRALVEDACGTSDYSNTITITLYDDLTGGYVGVDNEICYNTRPNTFIEFSRAKGGDGIYTYQWEESTNNGSSWREIDGAVSKTFRAGNLTETTKFRRKVMSAGCEPAYSNVITITVLDQPVPSIIGENQTICEDQTPEILTTIQEAQNIMSNIPWWQKFDGNNWNTLTIGGNYQPTPLSETTKYRKWDQNACGNLYSNEVTITVLESLESGSLNGDQQINFETRPAEILFSQAPSGGDGNYELSWEKSFNNSDWQPIGHTGEEYRPDEMIQDTYFRVKITSNLCGTVYTESIYIDVLSPLEPGTIGNSQNICSDNTPALLSGLPGFVEVGQISYQWYFSENGTSFSIIPTATGLSYQPPSLTKTTYYYRRASSGTYTPVNSNTVKIEVKPVPENPIISGTQDICYDTKANTIIIDSKPINIGILGYRWQQSLNNSNWSLALGDFLSENYDPPFNLKEDTYYRLQIITECGVVTSNVILVSVSDKLTSGDVTPLTQEICFEEVPQELVVSTPTGGDGNYDFQWQIKQVDDFIDIGSEETESYQPPSLENDQTYRVEINSMNCDPVYSKEITIEVMPEVIAGVIGNPEVICHSTLMSELQFYQLPTGGNNLYSYQWQESTNGSSFTDIPGATGITYRDLIDLEETTFFRVKVKSFGCDWVYTNTVTITVLDPIVPGDIYTDKTEICYETFASLITADPPTGGDGDYEFIWTTSPDGVFNTTVDTTEFLQFGVPEFTKTYVRRFVKSHNCQALSSNVIIIDMLPEVEPGTIEGEQAISNGSIPTIFTGTNASGGDDSFSYQWQLSLNGISFSDITGATSANYQSPALTKTTYFRRMVSSGGCDEIASNVIEVTVFDALFAGRIDVKGEGDDDYSVCHMTSPNTFEIVEDPIGGSGGFLKQWQKSTTDGASWDNIPGALGIEYTSPPLTEQTLFRLRIITSISEDTAYTNRITITVFEPFVSGQITDNQIICNSTNPEELIGELPTGGSGAYNFGWEFSSNDILYSQLQPNQNTSNYQPPQSTQSYYYRRTVTDARCGTLNSNSVFIQITPNIYEGEIEDEVFICHGDVPPTMSSIPPSGGSGVFEFIWEASVNAGDTWYLVAGKTDETLTLGEHVRTTFYRRIVSSINCVQQPTEAYKVFVFSPLKGGEISQQDDVICYNGLPKRFINQQSASGGNAEDRNYQWEISMTGKSDNWQEIPSAVQIDYSPNRLTESTYYRRRVTSHGCDTAYSNIVKITVLPEVDPGVIAKNQNVCADEIPLILFTEQTPTGGKSGYSEGWQSSLNDLLWNDIANSDSSFYQPDILNGSYYFRKKVVNDCSTKYTESILVNVYGTFKAGVIFDDQTIIKGKLPEQITGTSPLGGSLDYNYQWIVSVDSINWWNIAVNGNQEDLPPTNYISDTYLRRIDIDVCGIDTTNTVKIEVLPPLEPGIISDDSEVCFNGIPPTITVSGSEGGNGQYQYQWYESLDGEFWTKILVNSRSASYQPPPMTESKFFRREIIAVGFDTAVSNFMFINVLDAFVAPLIGQSQQKCFGDNLDAIKVIAGPSGGSGNYSYQWRESGNTVQWTDRNNDTNTFILPTQSTGLKYYQVKVTDLCGVEYSEPVSIQVIDKIEAGQIGDNQIIGYDNVPELFNGIAPITGSEINYQWQSSPDSILWDNILSGFDDKDYQATSLDETTYFRRIDKDLCSTDTTNIIKVTVLPDLIEGEISANQKICKGLNPERIYVTAPTGGSGEYEIQWQISDNAKDWEDILINARDTSYQPNIAIESKFYRRRVISPSYDTAYSFYCFVDIYEDLTPPVIVEDQVVCFGEDAQPIVISKFPTGGTGNYSYNWRQSSNGVAWVNMIGDTNTYIIPQNMIATRHYSVTVSDLCGFKNSEAVVVTVFPELDGGIIEPNTSIESGDTPPLFSGEDAKGGDGTYGYQWQRTEHLDSSFLDAIVNSTNRDFQEAALFDTMHYRRITYNSCKNDTSNVISINVLSSIIPGVISSNQTICNGDFYERITGTLPKGCNGTFFSSWEKSDDNINWLPIIGSNTLHLEPNILIDSTYYRRKDSSAFCQAVYTNTVLIAVRNKVESPTLLNSIPNAICKGDRATINIDAVDGLNYQWEERYENTSAAIVSNETSYTTEPMISVGRRYFISAINELECSSIPLQVRIYQDTIMADFDIEIGLVDIGTPVRFIDKSVGAISYNWEFYDGDGSELTNPYHYYNALGTYSAELVVTSKRGCNDTMYVADILKVVGTDKLFENSISIYPNPVIDVLNIEGERGTKYLVSIYDAVGRKLFVDDFEGTVSLNQLSTLIEGVYYVTLESAGKRTTSKIVKRSK